MSGMDGVLSEYEEVKRRKLSDHPGDWYLEVVLFKHKTQDRYATLMYHVGRQGYFEGHYDLSKDGAERDFETRQ